MCGLETDSVFTGSWPWDKWLYLSEARWQAFVVFAALHPTSWENKMTGCFEGVLSERRASYLFSTHNLDSSHDEDQSWWLSTFLHHVLPESLSLLDKILCSGLFLWPPDLPKSNLPHIQLCLRMIPGTLLCFRAAVWGVGDCDPHPPEDIWPHLVTFLFATSWEEGGHATDIGGWKPERLLNTP